MSIASATPIDTASTFATGIASKLFEKACQCLDHGYTFNAASLALPAVNTVCGAACAALQAWVERHGKALQFMITGAWLGNTRRARIAMAQLAQPSRHGWDTSWFYATSGTLCMSSLLFAGLELIGTKYL